MKYDNVPAFRGELWFLSNMFPCCVVYKGIEYQSSEHAFVTWKTLDPAEQDYINFHRSTTVYQGEIFEHCRPTTPQEAKQRGAQNRAGRKSDKLITLRDDWETIKFSIMEDVLRAKFLDSYLCTLLLATGERELVHVMVAVKTFSENCS